MTDTEQPEWRKAIHNNDHPLHKAVWLLFEKRVINLKTADRVLSDNKQPIIDFMLQILDTEDLYEGSALGGGYGPVNSVELLGHWQVTEVIPRLIRILKRDEWDDLVHDRAIIALEGMGQAVRDPLLAFADTVEKDEILRITTASILVDAMPGDEQAFEYIKLVFDEQKDAWDIIMMAENVLHHDIEAGIVFLEDRLKTRKYTRDVREHIQSYIQQVRDGTFNKLPGADD